MRNGKTSSILRTSAVIAVAGCALLLGGCVVAPVDQPYQVGTPVAYGDTVYAPAYGSSYYSAPYYYPAPAVSLGFFGLFGGGHGYSGGNHWNGSHRGNVRGNWNGHGAPGNWRGRSGAGHVSPGWRGGSRGGTSWSGSGHRGGWSGGGRGGQHGGFGAGR